MSNLLSRHIQNSTYLTSNSTCLFQSRHVEFRLNLIKRITYTLRLVGDPSNGIRWTLANGPFKVNNGGWVLREISPGRTHATYEIEVAVGAFVPGAIANKLVGKTLPATLRAFKGRAEAVARSGGSTP